MMPAACILFDATILADLIATMDGRGSIFTAGFNPLTARQTHCQMAAKGFFGVKLSWKRTRRRPLGRQFVFCFRHLDHARQQGADEWGIWVEVQSVTTLRRRPGSDATARFDRHGRNALMDHGGWRTTGSACWNAALNVTTGQLPGKRHVSFPDPDVRAETIFHGLTGSLTTGSGS